MRDDKLRHTSDDKVLGRSMDTHLASKHHFITRYRLSASPCRLCVVPLLCRKLFTQYNLTSGFARRPPLNTIDTAAAPSRPQEAIPRHCRNFCGLEAPPASRRALDRVSTSRSWGQRRRFGRVLYSLRSLHAAAIEVVLNARCFRRRPGRTEGEGELEEEEEGEEDQRRFMQSEPLVQRGAGWRAYTTCCPE